METVEILKIRENQMESGVNHIFVVEYVVRDFVNTEINPHTDAITVMCHVLEVKNLSRHFWTLLEIWHWLSCRNLS